ncbi:MAG: hypothetical protein JNJ84_02865, partial [Rhodobacteraceae bacterium]|nr:hypothetical protein [Paracoccaceae bacterium]
EAVLTAILVEAFDGQPVTAAQVRGVSDRIAPAAAASGAELDLDGWIAARLDEGGFALDAHEARIRRAALARAGGNLSAAARLLRISRAQLAYREKAAKE